MQLSGSKSKIRVNLTPLIDVVFILLIFFMLVSSFSQWRELPLELSTATSVSNSNPSISFVVLQRTEVISLNKQAITLKELLETLSAKLAVDAKHQIMLRAEQGVPLQQLISVLEKLKALAANNVSLAKNEVSQSNAP
ncbi:MAG: biopolymer transporter ExbD [Gammaproteobacteria bacterium]|jgi:biopolymer transport protein ExbD|nr:biopolymer transporter ExbD [Gammaproteobacteria bacterium]